MRPNNLGDLGDLGGATSRRDRMQLDMPDIPQNMPICKTWSEAMCCMVLTVVLCAAGIGIGAWYSVAAS